MFIAFLCAGAVSGAIMAYALDMKTPKEIAQGSAGRIDRRFTCWFYVSPLRGRATLWQKRIRRKNMSETIARSR